MHIYNYALFIYFFTNKKSGEKFIGAGLDKNETKEPDSSPRPVNFFTPFVIYTLKKNLKSCFNKSSCGFHAALSAGPW